MTDNKTFQRLPKNVTPRHYGLTLQVDLDNHTFTGSCKTDLIFSGESGIGSIKLNAVDITIQKASLILGNDTISISPEKIILSEKQELLELVLENEVSASKTPNGILALNFSGILNDKMKGFYRSSYKDSQGNTKIMATTQFEATDARRAFPCWDEPALKATFSTTLIVPPKQGYDFTVLSNTLCISQKKNNDGNEVYQFEKTPIMSTYLLAFVIGEFDFVEGFTEKKQKIRVYTPKGKKDQGTFALDVALKALPFYENFFGIDYPLSKCDLIAIPDFAAGAMENWGLITYRETALLISPKSSSASTKQWVAIVVSHELAHQWFGNLVTMEWWTHLWLNEGFASFCEYLCVNEIFPIWKIWDQFVSQDLAQAFNLDSLKSSHPVEVEVNSPDEVDEIFDTVSYSKGCSIIRMLESVVGRESFMKGLNLYLNEHTYKNTFTEDLWRALEKTSTVPVKKMMDSFTKQTGYPVLFIQKKGKEFEIEQYRFLKSGVDKSDSTLWQVPLTWKEVGSVKSELTIFGERKTTLPVSEKALIFNPNRNGFYRICYDPSLLTELKVPLSKLLLEPIDRLSIQTDSFALAQCGLLETFQVLELFESYKNESNYTVWSDLLGNLSSIASLVANESFSTNFNTWAASLLKGVSQTLGWDAKDNESHLDSLLRTLVLGKLVAFGDQATVNEAKERFKKFLENHDNLSPNLRSLVFRAVISQADQKIFDSMINLYKKFDMHEEKERVMRILGWAPTEDLLKQVLDFSLSSDVRSQDAVFCIETVAFNPKGSELAWKFLQEKWKELHKMYEGGFLLSRLISSICSRFKNKEKISEIKNFFKENPAPAAARSIEQACESIESNTNWLLKDKDGIENFLKKRN